MKKFEIWSEEIKFNGSSIPVQLHGTVEARCFKDACVLLANKNSEFASEYDIYLNTWFGAKLYDSKDLAENRGYMHPPTEITTVPYDDVLKEIEENPNILISALTRLIYKDVDEIPEDMFSFENEALRRKLHVAEQESKVLREHLEDKQKLIDKLKNRIQLYSGDCINEVELFSKTRIDTLESEANYYRKENERLEEAIRTLEGAN